MRSFPVVLLLAAALSACRPAEGRAGNPDTIGNFTEKSPMLPTTFVDTTGETYAWTKHYNVVQSLQNRIKPPAGFQRSKMDKGSFGYWLQRIPLKPGKPRVLLYNGEEKGYQGAHHAVIDMDVGKRDLQQCADACMRLRAEYLYSRKDDAAIHFNFTSGDNCAWSKWKQGYRPKISGNKVSFVKSAQASGTYNNFKAYLQKVFTFAGTASLSKEMKAISVDEMQPGDVFIQGGFPGHAVMVMDVATDASDKKLFLLAQSYMPAQEMHVLVNPKDAGLSPWYSADFGTTLETPEWSFQASDLKRFQ